MAKFKNRALPKQEQEAILLQFCQALVDFKNATEAAQFISDLLSLQEIEMLSLRLKIAEYLEQGMCYTDIEKKLQVSPITIARVQKWLRLGGDGYRAAIKKVNAQAKNAKSIPADRQSLYRNLKHHHPMYHWPELLLEEIVKTASVRHKAQLRAILAELDKTEMKAPLYKKLDSFLRSKS